MNIREILEKLKNGELIKDFKLYDGDYLIFRTRSGKWKMIEIEDGLIFYKRGNGWSATRCKKPEAKSKTKTKRRKRK